MNIQFIGAAETVTGSCHLVESNGLKFLLDCGLYQGKRKLAFELNRRFEFFNPEVIELHSFSAHADENEIIGYLNQFDSEMIQNLFLVHGDPEAQKALKIRLKSENYDKITIPKYGETFEL